MVFLVRIQIHVSGLHVRKVRSKPQKRRAFRDIRQEARRRQGNRQFPVRRHGDAGMTGIGFALFVIGVFCCNFSSRNIPLALSGLVVIAGICLMAAGLALKLWEVMP